MTLRLAALAAFLVIVAIAAWSLRQSGWDAREDLTEKENTDAANSAIAAELDRRDCATANGMRWDFAAGRCERDPENDR